MADAQNLTSLADRLEADAAAADARLAELEREYAEVLANPDVIQEDRDTTAKLVASARAAADAARDALSRYQAGTYGRCQECGEEISAERLEAVPDATRCVACSRR